MSDCKGCGGTRRCKNCDGKGKKMTSSTLGYERCKLCDGTGKCSACGGSGKG